MKPDSDNMQKLIVRWDGMEFFKEEELLDKEAQKALAQIANLNYQSEIKARGLTNIEPVPFAEKPINIGIFR